MNIDESAMFYISIDSSGQALQTNIKLFSNFEIIFRINYIFLCIIMALGLCMRGGGGICADSSPLSLGFDELQSSFIMTKFVKWNLSRLMTGQTIFVQIALDCVLTRTYYVFHGRVTLFFANNSLMQCRITVKFLHNFF